MALVDQLQQAFTHLPLHVSRFRDNQRVTVPAEHLVEVLTFLKYEAGCDMLIDITAVDYLEYPEAVDRYGVIYNLLNTSTGERLIVKTFVNDPDPQLPSMVPLWKSAEWTEREVYDMFGIRFVGHPDLRRILLPDEFSAYPLRKDYPLKGRGERHNFPVITRAES
ncbi:MAG: NADH-quinone oxidoreductase subunit C [Planctomycetaceae bacterium]|nr:MAG: NADH-quinone oxidoreductase subunit C [Planctomycetaceae bacterium]